MNIWQISINLKIGKKTIEVKWLILFVVVFFILMLELIRLDLGRIGVTVFYIFAGFFIGICFRDVSADFLITDDKKAEIVRKNKEKADTESEQFDRTAMLLVKRDMELTRTNRELDAKIKELENSKTSLLSALDEVRKTGTTLEEERNKTLAVVSNFTTPIIVLDKEGKLILFNPASVKSLGMRLLDYGAKIGSQDDYSIGNFKEVIRFEYTFNVINDEEKSDGVILVEEATVKNNGHDHTFKIITAMVTGKKGEQLGVMKIFYDLTREKVLDKLKSEFISVAAHQLRTPLAAIKWIFEMVLGGDIGPINEEQEKFLSKGHESNERIIELVNDLLNVSRIEEGRFGYSFGDHNFYEVLDGIIGYFDSSLSQSHIKLTVNKDNGIVNVRMDKERISMVLQNILENAIKYTPEFGRVEVDCKKEGNFLKLTVSDNGVGIPQADQVKLFSKFFRAANVMRMQTEGTGLGLFIAKNVVEKHGGTIKIDSKEGNGTKVIITLPL